MASPIGKQIGQRQYVGVDQLDSIDANTRSMIARALALLRNVTDESFNVIRIDAPREQIVFLGYPGLGDEPFPALKYSWRAELQTQRVVQRRFENSTNPPILHRTELLLSEDHPMRGQCRQLTHDCEQVGLFADPTRIGYYQQWHRLLNSHGYALDGFSLVPLGNDQTMGGAVEAESSTVNRHLTALTRSALSAPIQRLIKDGLLTSNSALFDYGCGRGDDLATLQTAGFAATGWDPHYNNGGAHTPADVVNLGFVINVIEDRQERCDALVKAFALTQKVLAVSAMLGSNDATKGKPFRDGILTSRSTFQKYFTQQELREFIESVLDEDAYPASPGVFYVFKDVELEQRFLLGRTKARVSPSPTPIIAHVRNDTTSPKAARSRKERAPAVSETVEGRGALDALWAVALDLGRVPDATEIPHLQEIERLFNSFRQAWRACLGQNDSAQLDKARDRKRDDILVMLALRTFERRRKLGRLDPGFARDIKVFFGSLGRAQDDAVRLLFSLNDPLIINKACEKAAVEGMGWLEPEESLHLHTSMLPALPAALRVYIGCASVMVGELSGFDLIKAHIRSGKVSLMAYDDFLRKPLPCLMQRIKVKLREQSLEIFDYGTEHAPPVLFRKSRYINEEFLLYAEQLSFEDQLEALATFDLDRYGPSETTVRDTLRSRRYVIDGFNLSRAADVPSLEEPCGRNFSFKQLIECGETWHAIHPDNVPLQAESYNAIADLCVGVLDPVIDYFGSIELTYCFASPELTKHISHGIAPELDQHAACERTRRGTPICSRGGAAVDFLVRDEDMYEVAKWISVHCSFDRIYLYGRDRPIHVSVGPQNSRAIFHLEERSGRRFPRPVDLSAL